MPNWKQTNSLLHVTTSTSAIEIIASGEISLAYERCNKYIPKGTPSVWLAPNIYSASDFGLFEFRVDPELLFRDALQGRMNHDGNSVPVFGRGCDLPANVSRVAWAASDRIYSTKDGLLYMDDGSVVRVAGLSPVPLTCCTSLTLGLAKQERSDSWFSVARVLVQAMLSHRHLLSSMLNEPTRPCWWIPSKVAEWLYQESHGIQESHSIQQVPVTSVRQMLECFAANEIKTARAMARSLCTDRGSLKMAIEEELGLTEGAEGGHTGSQSDSDRLLSL